MTWQWWWSFTESSFLMCCRFFLLPAQAQRGPSHLKRLFTGVTEKIQEILLCSSKGTLHISGRVWFCQPVLTYRVFSAQYQNGMKFPSTFLWNLTIESWKITIIDVDIFMVILPLQIGRFTHCHIDEIHSNFTSKCWVEISKPHRKL